MLTVKPWKCFQRL